MKKIFLFLATGFGVGYLKPFPGGFGSLEGFLISWLLFKFSYPVKFVVITLLTIFSFFIANEAEKIFNKKDPSQIVIDEIIGVLISSLFIFDLKETISFSFIKFTLYLFLAFLLFVIFDSFKPFPANKFQQLKGGLGVVLDDIMAGAYSGLCILLINFIK